MADAVKEFRHKPVLLREVIDGLRIRPDGIYADGTAGGGGHSYEIASRLDGGGKLVCVDRDSEAVAAAGERLREFKDRAVVLKGNYRDLPSVFAELGLPGADGILLDLGVSSHQFDDAERGFSYRYDARLDMRMDREGGLSAWEVVNTYPEKELARILRDYGEERFAAGIARRIVRERSRQPVETTLELAEIIKAAIPARMRDGKGHPAKKTFQALRIEVNGELDILKSSIDGLIGLLRPGGRLCIITFQSLEDRIVKQAFREAEDPCICPKDFPVCVCGRKSRGKVITRKAITAGAEELEENNRAHSAGLRIFERR